MSEKTKCTKVTIKPGSSVSVSAYSNPKPDCSATYGQHYVPKMPEYIEREAALKELNKNSITKKITFADGVSIFDTIKNIPAADVVEVVRCKECEHSHWEQEPCHGKTEYYCPKLKSKVDTHFYCALGKRKEGAEK